ncbi:MAG: sulfurtransferase TusA family protein [Pyramidobacter sp.]|nr:sulfurtransferase TusA family protein [Pyramidobacter sp.]
MIVDTRGLSCPQPVVEVKKAVSGGDTTIEVLLDNPTSQANVTRFMTKQGYSIGNALAENDGSTRIVFTK